MGKVFRVEDVLSDYGDDYQEDSKIRTAFEDQNKIEDNDQDPSLDNEKKVVQIYENIQKQIIEAGQEQQTKKWNFMLDQRDLTREVIYTSFGKTNIKLKSDNLFRRENTERLDFSLLDNCVKSINLTRMASPYFQNFLKKDEKFIEKTKAQLKSLEEIIFWDRQESYNFQQIGNFISVFSPQLKVLDLRGSQVKLDQVYSGENSKDFSNLRTLKVCRYFFYESSSVQQFLKSISSTLEHIEIINNLEEFDQSDDEKDNQKIDFSSMSHLNTFILHNSINSQKEKILKSLPPSIQILQLTEINCNFQSIKLNKLENLTHLTIRNNDDPFQNIKSLFSASNKSIKYLNLKNNDIKLKVLHKLQLQCLTQLETLILNHNPLQKEELDNDATYNDSELLKDSYFEDNGDDEENLEDEENDSANDENEEEEEEDNEYSDHESDEDNNQSKKKQSQKQKKKGNKQKFELSSIINPLKDCLINLSLRNCNITEYDFEKIDFINFKQLAKLDISRNKQFFKEGSTKFATALTHILWNLEELNVSSTNICISSNMQGIDFSKIKKLKVFKAKFANKIFLNLENTQESNSKEALDFMNAIIPKIKELHLQQFVVGVNWQKAYQLRSLVLSDFNFGHFQGEKRREQVTEFQKVIEQSGKRLLVLNMQGLNAEIQEMASINWSKLVSVRELNITGIQSLYNDSSLIYQIIRSAHNLEVLDLRIEDSEQQLYTIQWRQYPHLRNLRIIDETQKELYELKFNTDIFKSYLREENTFVMQPFQLLNTSCLRFNDQFLQKYKSLNTQLKLAQSESILENQKSTQNNELQENQINITTLQSQTSQINNIILERIHYELGDEVLSAIDKHFQLQSGYSLYNYIIWNIVRLDIFQKENLQEFQELLIKEVFNQQILYYNSINCLLYFIFSQINDQCYLDLVINKVLLKNPQIETLFIQQQQIEPLFYQNSKSENILQNLIYIFNNCPTKRVMVSYEIELNRSNIMYFFTNSKNKDDHYENIDFDQNVDSQTDQFVDFNPSYNQGDHGIVKQQKKSSQTNLNLLLMNESHLLDYLNFAPPEKLYFSNYTIQFFKYLYLIQHYSPYSFESKINYTQDSMPNSSISARLMRMQYQNGNNGKIYKFLNIFYSDPTFYQFDESVIQLNMQLSSKKQNVGLKILMLLMIPIYYFICIFSPSYLTYKFDLIESCGNGLSWYSYYVYVVFAVITLIMEYSLYVKILNTTSHLIPPAAIPPSTSTLGLIILQYKKTINKNRKFLYIVSLVNSQITRYNYFTDIGFIVSCYQCKQIEIMWISIAFVGIHTIINLISYVMLVFQKQKKFIIPTSEIDYYYQLSTLLEFNAVSDVLDLISPSNVVVFPVFLRRLRFLRLDRLAGVAFNGRIFYAIQRFLLEDFPQLALQIAYLINENKINSNIILSFISTFLTLLIQLYKFLSIRPSAISQLDFDKLNLKKKQESWKFEQKIKQLQQSTNQNIINNLKKMNLNPAFNSQLRNFYTFKSHSTTDENK